MVQKSCFYLTTLSSPFFPRNPWCPHCSQLQSWLPATRTFPSLPSAMPCHRPPLSPTSTGPPHTHRALPTLCAPPAISHLALHGTHCSSPDHSLSRQNEGQALLQPQLPVFLLPTSTPAHIYLKKKSPLRPNPFGGWMLGRGGLFLSMLSRHSGKQHYLSLAPSSAPDKRGFPLDLLFKTCPKTGTRWFQINELEPWAGGCCPCPHSSARCPHSTAPASSVSHQPIHLLVALPYWLI